MISGFQTFLIYVWKYAIIVSCLMNQSGILVHLNSLIFTIMVVFLSRHIIVQKSEYASDMGNCLFLFFFNQQGKINVGRHRRHIFLTASSAISTMTVQIQQNQKYVLIQSCSQRSREDVRILRE
jgi:hypothetical protein